MNRSRTSARRAVALSAAGATALALAIMPVTAAAAAPGGSCDKRNNNTVAKLLECVSAEGALEHLQAFQDIANANGGNRAAATPGYEASVDYVVETLEAAGWKVSIDEFDYFLSIPSVQQLTPVNVAQPAGYFSTGDTAAGSVTGTVIPVDLAIANPATSTSGCEAADFAGLNFLGTTDIALIQRGACEFGIKARNAYNAGAEAVVIMNQGNAPDRMDALTNVTLIGANPTPLEIPVVSTSFQGGVSLAQPGSTATVTLAIENHPQKNVIAELPGRNPGNVVMAGAHLDSVPAGPGINDNGSGSAALLELAQSMQKVKPQNTVRLAWWAAEEEGLLGSAAYVDGLNDAEKDRIALYLNFDMVASPNYIFMVYDGDESTWEAPVVVPEGSVQIEDLFESYFTSVGVPYDDAEFSGRSDYEAFILNGIPAGGLFTGAEDEKTPEQAEIWGGTAGEWLDPCYHQACDDIDNLSLDALETNSDAIALAVLAYAYSTQSVNGVPGVDVPGGLTLPAPAGAEGTWAGGGGGLHGHDHDPVAD
ncbi:M28 family metallopeptidase [Microbacterium sp. M3]|uniref:M28 family metallopeptidase n=1 Tax=Microbacterium arthrosphaerae TaxID=792652 RepID=A0ABU4H3N3_9MICO|nr:MULTISPECIES: M28 family metallopeptidase [Microbacterium]MDW4573939.1 M28 family metallopeptidase [Microbacterium arthrosphaerae]MDW7607794.1 M28 family metallopeptidase [Microbacterium sp. M3]